MDWGGVGYQLDVEEAKRYFCRYKQRSKVNLLFNQWCSIKGRIYKVSYYYNIYIFFAHTSMGRCVLRGGSRREVTNI